MKVHRWWSTGRRR